VIGNLYRRKSAASVLNLNGGHFTREAITKARNLNLISFGNSANAVIQKNLRDVLSEQCQVSPQYLSSFSALRDFKTFPLSARTDNPLHRASEAFFLSHLQVYLTTFHNLCMSRLCLFPLLHLLLDSGYPDLLRPRFLGFEDGDG
jgi:hypothetical protein